MVTLPSNTALNGICPYFTMFPLDFPYAILQRRGATADVVLDPFCGRGTTNYASRLLGITSIGIDSSPVAVALSEAKLVPVTPQQIVDEAQRILHTNADIYDMPEGTFWELAYDPETLRQICLLRQLLLADCRSAPRKALRAIILGALHGPLGKHTQSYFSNQCQRTYAPKPAYAVRYWRTHGLTAPRVDVGAIIQRRAERYYASSSLTATGYVIQGDSRHPTTFAPIADDHTQVSWVVTSPPYYGMRTYLPDQWLRIWFLGGTATVCYANTDQVEHTSPATFASNLAQVWRNIGTVARPGARMVVRFGSINDRKVPAESIFKQSLHDTGWRLQTRKSAGSASDGRRQALHFAETQPAAMAEYDFWALWEG